MLRSFVLGKILIYQEKQSSGGFIIIQQQHVSHYFQTTISNEAVLSTSNTYSIKNWCTCTSAEISTADRGKTTKVNIFFI